MVDFFKKSFIESYQPAFQQGQRAGSDAYLALQEAKRKKEEQERKIQAEQEEQERKQAYERQQKEEVIAAKLKSEEAIRKYTADQIKRYGDKIPEEFRTLAEMANEQGDPKGAREHIAKGLEKPKKDKWQTLLEMDQDYNKQPPRTQAMLDKELRGFSNNEGTQGEGTQEERDRIHSEEISKRFKSGEITSLDELSESLKSYAVEYGSSMYKAQQAATTGLFDMDDVLKVAGDIRRESVDNPISLSESIQQAMDLLDQQSIATTGQSIMPQKRLSPQAMAEIYWNSLRHKEDDDKKEDDFSDILNRR